MGRAENAQEVVSKVIIVLAPLLFGAGIKGKLLDAKWNPKYNFVNWCRIDV